MYDYNVKSTFLNIINGHFKKRIAKKLILHSQFDQKLQLKLHTNKVQINYIFFLC